MRQFMTNFYHQPVSKSVKVTHAFTVLEQMKKTHVFVKHECPRRQQSPNLAIFSIKAMVKVKRSIGPGVI